MKAVKVKDVSDVQDHIDDMLEIMYATKGGIGLAATQVSRPEAIIVIDISETRDSPLILINPEVIEGRNKKLGEEGCLSVPGIYGEVERFSEVVVSGLDRQDNLSTTEDYDF